MGILTQGQFQRLAEALNKAFDPLSLGVLVANRINKLGISQYVNQLLPADYQATVLAQRAESDDFTGKLILSAREARPRNAEFAALAHELALTSLGDSVALEVVVRKQNKYQDMALWRMTFTEIESRVCSIRVRGTVKGASAIAYGTGLLVGAECVLTNYHVIAALMGKSGNGFEARPEDVTLRFDYKRLRNDVLYEGDEFSLGDPWLIDASPMNELDYALIRLSQKAGEKTLGGWMGIQNPPVRGSMQLSRTDDPYAPDSALLIPQHPNGKELVFAYDTASIIGLKHEGRRLHHRTNTEGGSSGSPYFNAALELIGIHHGGDAKTYPTYNVGIPINPIVERVKGLV